eukprot:9143468-Heterocapsa_arctica.AAC.1
MEANIASKSIAQRCSFAPGRANRYTTSFNRRRWNSCCPAETRPAWNLASVRAPCPAFMKFSAMVTTYSHAPMPACR